MEPVRHRVENEVIIKGFYEREGLVAVASLPEELRRNMAADIKKYGDVIRARNIPLR